MAYEQQARQDHELWKRGRAHAHLSIDSEKFSPVATTSENTPSTSKARRIQPLSLDDDEDDEEDGVSFTSKDFLDDESQITDFKQLEKRSIRSSTRKIVTEETAPSSTSGVSSSANHLETSPIERPISPKRVEQLPITPIRDAHVLPDSTIQMESPYGTSEKPQKSAHRYSLYVDQQSRYLFGDNQNNRHSVHDSPTTKSNFSTFIENEETAKKISPQAPQPVLRTSTLPVPSNQEETKSNSSSNTTSSSDPAWRVPPKRKFTDQERLQKYVKLIGDQKLISLQTLKGIQANASSNQSQADKFSGAREEAERILHLSQMK